MEQAYRRFRLGFLQLTRTSTPDQVGLRFAVRSSVILTGLKASIGYYKGTLGQSENACTVGLCEMQKEITQACFLALQRKYSLASFIVLKIDIKV